MITDAQAGGWKEMGAIRSEVFDGRANVEIMVTGPGEQPNLGLSDPVFWRAPGAGRECGAIQH